MWWRRQPALITYLAADALIVFMLTAAVARAAGGPGPSAVIMLLAAFGGFLLVRGLQRFDAATPVLVGVASAGTLLAMLVLINLQYNFENGPLALGWLGELVTEPEELFRGKSAEVIGIVAILVAWFRGGLVAQRELTYTRALASYSVGLVITAVLLLFVQGSGARTAINGAALPYFMCGLLTLALVHLSRADATKGGLLSGPWLATLGGTIGTIAAVSLIIGLFPINFLNTVLAPVGWLALRVLDIVIFAIAVPIAFLVTLLLNLLLGDRQLNFPEVRQDFASDAAQQALERGEQGGPPEFLILLAKTIFLLLLAVAIGYALWRAYRRLVRPPVADASGEEREALSGSIGSDLGALLGSMLGRFRRGESTREPDLPADVRAVRRLYVRALDRAEQAATPRPASATPREFSTSLADALHNPAAVTLSERFAAARYGMVPPSKEELAALERAGERLS